MKKSKIKKKANGFTIIEVMVYTLIFSLFILLATQLFLTIKSMTANSAAMANLQQNYVRIYSDLNQTLRMAGSVTLPTVKGAGPSLSLDAGQSVYQLNNGVLEKVVNGQVYELSDEGVAINSLVFENIGEATQAASIKVSFSMQSNYLLEGSRTINEDFQTAFTLR